MTNTALRQRLMESLFKAVRVVELGNSKIEVQRVGRSEITIAIKVDDGLPRRFFVLTLKEPV